jgi:hypothetical protein
VPAQAQPQQHRPALDNRADSCYHCDATWFSAIALFTLRGGVYVFGIPFNHLVSLQKRNGELFDGIKAFVNANRVFIKLSDNDNMPPIETGDTIKHKQSNGITEEYLVTDPCYYDIGHRNPMGKHYQCHVRKLSAEELRQQTNSVININATQANVAQGNATVIAAQNIGVDAVKLQELLQAVLKATPSDVAQDVEDNLSAIQNELTKPVPKKSVLRALLNALKSISKATEFCANVATLAQYIQALPL